jgi:glycosyltransferase involved in cell wall biosynthesis
MAWGNGAYVLHKLLEKHLAEYRVIPYNPKLELFPFLLPFRFSMRNAELIHTTPTYACFFHRKSIPMILTFHGYVSDRSTIQYSSLLQKIHHSTTLRFLTKLSTLKAHALTAVSHYTARIAKQDLKINMPIRVIYNGIDENHFTPGAGPKSTQKEIRVFFSGNLNRRKGVHWIPKIAKLLNKNTRIYYTQGLRTRNILKACTEVISIGSVTYENMPIHYRKMDILLMPTVREGFGLAIAEAMACGLPVVASNCSAIPELIDEGKGGFLCPVGDVDAFAEKINLLADSPILRREMGNYNRAKVEKMFTLERMANEYEKLFEEVMAG